MKQVIDKFLMDKRPTLEAIALACVGLPLLLISISRLVYPYDLGHYEACIWAPALLSVSSHNPYSLALQPPYVMAPYGYFYYLLIGIGLKLFGYQLWIGRALSLLAIVLCIFCLGRIAWLLTQKRQATFIAVFAFLSLFPVQAWIGLHRPDLPALALALVGLWLVFESDRYNLAKTRVALNIIALCLVSAFFFKQTIILPICIATSLFFQKGRHKSAFYILLMITVAILLIAIALNRTSEGAYYLQHFALAREIPHDYLTSIQMVARLIKEPATFLLLSAAIIFLLPHLKRFKISSLLQRYKAAPNGYAFFILRSPKLLIFLYFLLSLILGFITSSRRGSNVNYYLEASVIGSIALALAWDSFTKEANRQAMYGLLIALVSLASMFQLVRIGRGEYFRWQSLPYYREIVTTLKNHTPEGTICISAYPELAVFAGREYHFGDWMQYNDGRSNELRRVFLQAVESQKYPAIIWPDTTLSDSFPGYRLLQMKNSPPRKFYAVYLFFCDQVTSR